MGEGEMGRAAEWNFGLSWYQNLEERSVVDDRRKKIEIGPGIMVWGMAE
jgi:hypothetical protein